MDNIEKTFRQELAHRSRVSSLIQAIVEAVRFRPEFLVVFATDSSLVLRRFGPREAKLTFIYDHLEISFEYPAPWGEQRRSKELRLDQDFRLGHRVYSNAAELAQRLLALLLEAPRPRSSFAVAVTSPITEFIRQYTGTDLRDVATKYVRTCSRAQLIEFGRNWTEYVSAYRQYGISALKKEERCFTAFNFGVTLGPLDPDYDPAQEYYPDSHARNLMQYLLYYPRVAAYDHSGVIFWNLAHAHRAEITGVRETLASAIRLYDSLSPWLDSGRLLLIPDYTLSIDSAGARDALKVFLSPAQYEFWTQVFKYDEAFKLDEKTVTEADKYLKSRGYAVSDISELASDVAAVIDCSGSASADPVFWSREQVEIFRWYLSQTRTEKGSAYMELVLPPEKLNTLWLPDLSNLPTTEIFAVLENEDLFAIWRETLHKVLAGIEPSSVSPSSIMVDLARGFRHEMKPLAERINSKMANSRLGPEVRKQAREFAITAAAVYALSGKATPALATAALKSFINLILKLPGSSARSDEQPLISLYSFFAESPSKT